MSGNRVSRKAERLEARVTAEQKELFQRAADLTGRSLTDFVVTSVQAAAAEAIRNHQVMQLTPRETTAFVDAFLNPRQSDEVVQKHARRYRALLDRQ